jgi:hypothetical protein
VRVVQTHFAVHFPVSGFHADSLRRHSLFRYKKDRTFLRLRLFLHLRSQTPYPSRPAGVEVYISTRAQRNLSRPVF